MEKLCIDVRGFSVKKKMWVQDAFFELGYKWFGSESSYQCLDAGGYTNKPRDFAPGLILLFTHKIDSEFDGSLTYPELMRKVGMDEGDPDVPKPAPPQKVGSLTLEVETDLQSIISDYLQLLDAIKDPYARGVIKSQITDLTDLQYNQLTGERTNA